MQIQKPATGPSLIPLHCHIAVTLSIVLVTFLVSHMTYDPGDMASKNMFGTMADLFSTVEHGHVLHARF